MLEDGLKVSLSFEKDGEGLSSVSLSSSFIPDDQSLALALPISDRTYEESIYRDSERDDLEYV